MIKELLSMSKNAYKKAAGRLSLNLVNN
ncbi:TPA: hypothetical protein ACXDAZ_002189 [Clostridium botulinum]